MATLNSYSMRVLLLMSDSVFGFLAGSVAAGASVYYYILGDYRLSNEMLSDDIAVCLYSSLVCDIEELTCSYFILVFHIPRANRLTFCLSAL